jgi:hypothetical protein
MMGKVFKTRWRTPRNSTIHKQKDQNRKTIYLFLENPDKQDITMFTILMMMKLFTMAKGKGVVKAWQVAVDEMNSQTNKSTCHNLFDPPIAIKTLCWRFDNAMKLIVLELE